MDRAFVNAHVTRMAKRAEKAPAEVLRDSFVPVPSLLAQLMSNEHQVLYGRRGTGKTHLLRYLQSRQDADGALVVYLDLRNVGAAEDVFATGQESFAEHATRLLVDVLEGVHTQVLDQLVTDRWSSHLTEVSVALDRLAEAATQVRVVGETEVAGEHETAAGSTKGSSLTVDLPDRKAAWQSTSTLQASERTNSSRLQRGTERHHVLLGPLSAAMRSLAAAIAPHELWILVDEWSAIPLELQPLLADLVRRTFFPLPGVTVKISALLGRSSFADVDGWTGVGLELGADTSATLDLDEFLMFHNEAGATLAFYAALLHRHLAATVTRVGRELPLPDQAMSSPNQLIKYLFDGAQAFHHVVIGAEGVPRDALQILGLAAAGADDRPITTNDVDTAIRNFFLRDKEGRIPRHARHAFNRLIEQCAKQNSRLVPLRRDGESDDDVIRRLYDARVIHRVRQGISLDPTRPTTLFDIYLMDMGAFLGIKPRARSGDSGLDMGARFADADQIEIRGRTFSRLPPRWYSERSRPPRSR